MWIFFWFLFSVAVGIGAANRGRSGLGWFLLACIISPLLALIFLGVSKNLAASAATAVSTPSAKTHVRCTACAEFVLPEANKCKHCGTALTSDPTYTQRVASAKEAEDRKNLMIGVGFVAACIFIAWLFGKS